MTRINFVSILKDTHRGRVVYLITAKAIHERKPAAFMLACQDAKRRALRVWCGWSYCGGHCTTHGEHVNAQTATHPESIGF